MSAILPYVIAITAAATLVRSTFGFGESLVAVPLFALLIPIDVAVPLSVLISVLVALVVVVQDRRSIELESAKWLIVFAALGIPAGLAVLVYAEERVVKIALGALMVLYSGYSLFAKRMAPLERDDWRWLFACGFVSGVMGGAYGLNGPPLVVFGNLRRWSAQHFRATLQAYFLPASLLGVVGYAAKGLISWTVARYFVWCLPAVVPAIFLGRYLNLKLRGEQFFIYVYVGLIALGGLLVAFTVANIRVG